jgi:hypothetical protein
MIPHAPLCIPNYKSLLESQLKTLGEQREVGKRENRIPRPPYLVLVASLVMTTIPLTTVSLFLGCSRNTLENKDDTGDENAGNDDKV